MKAVIFVVHGSQIRQKNKALAKLINQASESLADYADFYQIAYLERQRDTIELVINRIVKTGAKELIIIPVLLFPALHALVDIPIQVKAALRGLPEITVKFLRTFGEAQSVFEILLDRIQEIDSDFSNAEIILLAHGTRHFAEAELGLARVANKLSEYTGKVVKPVDFLGKRTYRSIIETNLQNSIPQVVLPFFIYDGVLVQKIYHSVQALSPSEAIPFAETLALDPRIVSALVNVIQEEQQFDTNFVKLTT
ncbi:MULTISPECIES: sirohydrochlorin chelatase [unclassified Enterococcus]|uniref:sirohydrochlorin chelatase n=1 Tax=unclassified Enterococcus TaxID=2608891 RepID=UPI0015550D61|nr:MULTISPECIES: sirohydrochlorin chelatase [unclassified Enterococcus]MBS7576405.1 sirohydrochlorin chelatase [Enterococcus sp. MMGLQ5-2]MBS7583637.1 sirohydrochlorin chelatase [Enterococcus sp. MMGLQ5-1]NPD11498.1 sirohydrochlorin chelatase [Enterococcus sp. MMGLQ5-1]NPD36242.1 sirohydrochlorin chelatase [Enterococcus sp. MMGLQ5-2]